MVSQTLFISQPIKGFLLHVTGCASRRPYLEEICANPVCNQMSCYPSNIPALLKERNSFDLQMFRKLLDTTFFSRARVKKTVSDVVITVYAFPTIKMTAFDASVSMASQENLAVGIFRFVQVQKKPQLSYKEVISNRFFISSQINRTEKLLSIVSRWFQFQWRIHHQSRWRQTNPSVM